MRFAHPVHVSQENDTAAPDAQDDNQYGGAGRWHPAKPATLSSPSDREIRFPLHTRKAVLERLASSVYFFTATRSIASPYRPKYHEHFMFALTLRHHAILTSEPPLALRIAATLFAVLVCAALSPAISAQSNTDILQLSQVRPGMQGYAYTIFAGDQIEKFDLEVIGVMPNFLGPQQSIILVQLKGEKVEHTGVVAGMSGSPVYLDGKLAGALSLKLGVFTKEAIGGVTPIEDILSSRRPATTPHPSPRRCNHNRRRSPDSRANIFVHSKRSRHRSSPNKSRSRAKPPYATPCPPVPLSSLSQPLWFSPDSNSHRSDNSPPKFPATASSPPKVAPPRPSPTTKNSHPATWPAWSSSLATPPSTPPAP